MRILASLGDAFDARNQFLQVLLGLLALEGRLAALVDGPADADVPPAPADHPFTHLVLGLVAVGQRLHAHLDALAPDAGAGVDVPPPPSPAAGRLRDLLL
jgi:hypothetical protein